MTRETIKDGVVAGTSSATWFGFPDEIQEKLVDILKPYGYQEDQDDSPDVDQFLWDIELMCRNTNCNPWAIIFCSGEYPLAGHLMSIRPSREILFSSYSLIRNHSEGDYDPMVDGPPPLSVMFVLSKAALLTAGESGSPLLHDAVTLLTEKSEDTNWVVLADSLDPLWVRSIAKESEDLFYEITGISRQASPMGVCK